MKVHIVEDLKANMLIDTNTITPQEICVDLKTKVYRFGKCQGLKVPIDVTTKSKSNSRRTIRNKVPIIIAPGVTVKVSVAYKKNISKDRDFLFELNYAQNFEPIDEVFAYIVDFTISIIQVYNATTASIRLSRKSKLEALYKYKQDDVFIIAPANVSLTIENVKL